MLTLREAPDGGARVPVQCRGGHPHDSADARSPGVSATVGGTGQAALRGGRLNLPPAAVEWQGPMTQPRHGSWSFYFAALGLLLALGTALVLAFGLSPLVNVALGVVVAVFFGFWLLALHGRGRIFNSPEADAPFLETGMAEKAAGALARIRLIVTIGSNSSSELRHHQFTQFTHPQPRPSSVNHPVAVGAEQHGVVQLRRRHRDCRQAPACQLQSLTRLYPSAVAWPRRSTRGTEAPGPAQES